MSPVLIPPLTPGSPEWFAHMSASKVAAVMGTSPYESRFSLWLRMHGDLGPQDVTDDMRRGHYFEAAIAAWFADQHPELTIAPSECWRHDTEPWIATPDRVTSQALDTWWPLEVKTDAGGDPEWGESGTAQVPAGYYDQVQWQMLVMGAPCCHVAVALPFFDLREYLVPFDPDRAAVIEAEVRAFMASLDTGERPDLDAHGATYLALRDLHPDINGEKVELTFDTAEEFVGAKAAVKHAKAREQAAVSEVAAAMGDAQTAVFDGITVATRQAKNGGTPYVVAARNLPSTFLTEIAEDSE